MSWFLDSSGTLIRKSDPKSFAKSFLLSFSCSYSLISPIVFLIRLALVWPIPGIILRSKYCLNRRKNLWRYGLNFSTLLLVTGPLFGAPLLLTLTDPCVLLLPLIVLERGSWRREWDPVTSSTQSLSLFSDTWITSSGAFGVNCNYPGVSS